MSPIHVCGISFLIGWLFVLVRFAWPGLRRQLRGAEQAVGSPIAPKKERCVGYTDRLFYRMMLDCRAYRSKVCLDGRCVLHCRENCRCEAGALVTHAPKGPPNLKVVPK